VRGRYQVGDRVEDFSLVADRYVTAGLVLDLATGHFEAEYDGWVLRGGVVGGEALWVRGEDRHRAHASAFTALSPAYDLALARLLRLQVGSSRRLALVELTEPVGAARTVRRTWTRTPSEEADLQRYQVDDADTGERTVVHLAGDVLVSREGRQPAHLLDLDTDVSEITSSGGEG
jgi:hypothetical protein